MICGQNTNITIMTYKKIFATPRGDPVRLFGLPWSFTPNRCLSTQKEISVSAHLLPSKKLNLEKLTFSEKKIFKL